MEIKVVQIYVLVSYHKVLSFPLIQEKRQKYREARETEAAMVCDVL